MSSSSSSWLRRASGISAGAALSYSSSIASLAQTVSPGAGSDEAGLQTARSKVRSKHALKVVGRSSREEMGHVHGDRLADLPLPRKLRDELIAAGQAEPHHVLPNTGQVSCWMTGPEVASRVTDLFRIQYQGYATSKRV